MAPAGIASGAEEHRHDVQPEADGLLLSGGGRGRTLFVSRAQADDATRQHQKVCLQSSHANPTLEFRYINCTLSSFAPRKTVLSRSERRLLCKIAPTCTFFQCPVPAPYLADAALIPFTGSTLKTPAPDCWRTLCPCSVTVTSQKISLYGPTSASAVASMLNVTVLSLDLIFGSGSTTLTRSEEHTSELQSRGLISYAVFC